MANEQLNKSTITDDLMDRLLKEKSVAYQFQERRHEDWNDNYELYRNKVRTNRLTQRQAVNIPLMKETIKTLLSKIDDPPSVSFKEKDGELDKEIVLQARWDEDFERLNFTGVDIQDKKTVMLYGRAFKKLNFLNDEFDVTALDIFDIVIDPLTDPLDIETAGYLIQQNIFRSLREVLANPRYTKEAKDRLKTYMSTEDAIIQSTKNKEALEAKQERLMAMGVNESDFDTFSAGDVILNLSEHYTKLWDEKKKEFVRYVVVYVDDQIRLMKAPLKELLGVEFLPFVTWGEDLETQDFWSDGPADLVRVPNKVANIFFSQMVENRTLKNFQMYWYDSGIEGYQPQQFAPGPGRLLPAPPVPSGGRISDVLMPVEVSGLDDTMGQIDFLIRLVERGTSATAIEKGVGEKKQTTLGEVETLVGKAAERTFSMAKFYRRSWKELATKWYLILEANDGKTRTLYKTSARGKVWPKKVRSLEWKSKAGYLVETKSSSEQESEASSGIQKMFAIMAQFPQNAALRKIAQRRSLEMLDLTPEELREVEEEEKKIVEQPEQTSMQAESGEDTQLASNIQNNLGELSSLNGQI